MKIWIIFKYENIIKLQNWSLYQKQEERWCICYSNSNGITHNKI